MATKKKTKEPSQGEMNNNLRKAKALEKIVEHNRDFLKLDITLPLVNPALKQVHTNQWLWTALPKEFDLINWDIIAKALNSNVNRYEGYVESVRIFFTTLRTFDNKMVKIPNSKLTSDSVVNCSVGELRRVKNVFSVSYDDNINKVRSVILDVISKNDMIVSDPEPKVYVTKHLDSGVEITVFTWGNHDNYFAILFYMEEQVKNAFDKNGITIPYPHIVVKK